MPWERQPLLTLGLLVFQMDRCELVDHEDDEVAVRAGLLQKWNHIHWYHQRLFVLSQIFRID